MYHKIPSLVERPPAKMFQNLFCDFFDFDYKLHDRGLISVLIFFVTDCFSEQQGRLLFLGKLKCKACWYCEWISFILPSSSTDQRAAQVVLVQVEVGGDRKGPMIFI